MPRLLSNLGNIKLHLELHVFFSQPSSTPASYLAKLRKTLPFTANLQLYIYIYIYLFYIIFFPTLIFLTLTSRRRNLIVCVSSPASYKQINHIYSLIVFFYPFFKKKQFSIFIQKVFFFCLADMPACSFIFPLPIKFFLL